MQQTIDMLEDSKIARETKAGALSKIAGFFQNWSGDDEAGETLALSAAELREMAAWYTSYCAVRRKLDELEAYLMPHVLLLDEIETPCFCYIEDEPDYHPDPAVIFKITKDKVCMCSPNGEHRFPRDEYGKEWRLWAGTAYPTEPYRRAAKWEQG